MKIKQLGNGGGFDFNQTNSSFLISPDDKETEYLLFDCGFNVMARLQNEEDPIDISKINNVFISHMDEDHVGNLKMLIYWRYFMLQKPTNVVCSSLLNEKLISYLDEMNKELIGSQSTVANMYTITTISNLSNEVGFWRMQTTPTFHGSIVCNGLIISSEARKGIFISGDTKSSKIIEDVVKKYEYKNGNILKFHDYSNWDCVTRNVHACRTDYGIEYSEEFQKDTIKYHTGENFNKGWRNV